jgi:hypothetical protein
MTAIYEPMRAWFRDNGWHVTEVEDQPLLRLGFVGRNGTWNCVAQAIEEAEQFVFYSLFPELVAPEHRPAMAELITRINHGLVIGNLELGYDEGDVRMKTSVDVEGHELAPALIRQVVHANVEVFDAYVASIAVVLGGAMSPTDALTLAPG